MEFPVISRCHNLTDLYLNYPGGSPLIKLLNFLFLQDSGVTWPWRRCGSAASPPPSLLRAGPTRYPSERTGPTRRVPVAVLQKSFHVKQGCGSAVICCGSGSSCFLIRIRNQLPSQCGSRSSFKNFV